MAMKEELLAFCVLGGLGAREDLLAPGLEEPVADGVADIAAGLERRVELDDRLGPEESFPQLLLDVRINPGVADVDEAAREVRVVIDEALAKVEDVQPVLPSVEDGCRASGTSNLVPKKSP
jgi:hypothetical protein